MSYFIDVFGLKKREKLLRDELYVMLMLQRSEEGTSKVDCDDAAIAVACALDSDKCPAECKEDSNKDEEKEDTVVKSGDLMVTAVANKGASVISNGATSELDTLTFKASEDITLNSITLERYGLSKYDSVAAIWLENEDGVKITNEKTISSSKDTVTLSIKKDYQTIEDGDSVIVVVRTPKPSTSTALGTNIGFKVISVEASAKNLDLSDYSANLYNIIDYTWNDVNVAAKWADKNYNYEEGKSYEVAKLKVTATNAAVNINGFTLTQAPTRYCTAAEITAWSPAVCGAVWASTSTVVSPAWDLDLNEYIDEVEVLVDGVAAKNVSYSTKRDELKVSFDDQEIAINKGATFTVNVSLKDFDEFSSIVRLQLESASDINAYEVKNGVRISVKTATPMSLAKYVFNGGKVTLTNTKLNSTIDAAAGSDDVVVAEGSISVWGQTVRLDSLTLTPSLAGVAASGLTPATLIESLKLSVDGEDYEADNTWTFKDITIENDSKIQLLVDLYDVDTKGDIITLSFTPSLFNSAANSFGALKYDDVKNAVSSVIANGSLVWSISISKLKVQPSKGSLTNDLSKKVEFKMGETTSDKVLLDGVYTAKKNNVHLNSATITKTSGTLGTETTNNPDITFHLYIDGDEVASFDWAETQDFSEVVVEAGKSVKVKVTADVYTDRSTTANLVYEIALDWDDDNGNTAGTASEPFVDMTFVAAESITVSSKAGFNKQDLVLADKDQTVAKFTVKPGNKADAANLDTMIIKLDTDYQAILDAAVTALSVADVTKLDAENYFKVKIGNDDADNLAFTINAGTDKTTYPYLLNITDINTDLESNGSDVEVIFKKELTTAATPVDYTLVLSTVNTDTTVARQFDRKAVNALIRVVSQEWEKAANTSYKFEIEYASNAINESITSVSFTYKNKVDALNNVTKTWSNVQEGDTYQVANNDKANYVDSISYVDGDWNTVTVTSTAYPDFFKVDGTTTDLQAYANS